MEKNKGMTQKAKTAWGGLSTPLKILIPTVAAVLLVVVAFLLVSSTQTDYEVLQTGLSPDEAAEATKILGDLGVDYQVEGVSSVTINVPSGSRSQVLLSMQQEGFPMSDTATYDMYTQYASGMGVTDQDKMVFEGFADEQRLSYIISQMDKIETASVMISYAQQSQFALSGNELPAQASVLLTLEPNETLSDSEADAIRSTVMTSVPGLLAENITIADNNMRVYRMQGDISGESGSDMDARLALKQEHQELIKEQVYALLTPVFGAANVTVSANVELDFDKVSSTSVTYTPPGDADNMGIIVGLQQSAQRAGAESMSGGAVGFDSNGAAPFYPETLDGEEAPAYAYTQTINAELNEVHELIEEEQGEVTAVSVSIMLDADEAWEAELPNVTTLISNAIGIDPQYVSIMRTPFKVNEDYAAWLAENEELLAAEAAAAEAAANDNMMFYIIIGALALLLIALVILGIISNKRSKKKFDEELARLEQENAQNVATLTAMAEEENVRNKLDAGGAEGEEIPETPSKERLRKIQELAEENPDSVANLLRNWLSDDSFM